MKYIFFFIAILFFAACNEATAPSEEQTAGTEVSDIVVFTQEQSDNAGIRTGQPEKRSMYSVIHVNGTVDVPPSNRISISFPLGGYLSSTKLIPGMKVKRGDVLAVMQDQAYVDLQEDYLVAAAKLKMLTSEHERQSTLHAAKSSSDKVLEQTEAEFNAQRATVSALKQKLLLIGIQPEKLTAENITRTVNVLSPINGYVSTVNVNVGTYLAPTDIMFELVDPSDIHLSLTVFDKDLPLIQAGQKVSVHLVSDPSKKYSSEVILVGKQLDENRAALVHCEFTDTPAGVLPGMFVSAEIEIAKANSVAVPADAVVRLKESEFVFVQESNLHFRKVKVATGITQDGWIELLPGEENLEGKTLITANAWSALMMLENKAE